MSVPITGARRRRPSRRARGLAAIAALVLLNGCGPAMEALVGKPPGSAPGAPATPPPPPPTTAFVTDSDLSPGFTGQTIVPPTLPPTPGEDANPGAEPLTSAGPRKAIASLPITSDPAKLAELGAAANREGDLTDARFVLLALTPPAADAAAFDRANTATRQAVTAALKALADAGIPPEHVDVSLATGFNVGAGLLRLYRR